MPEPESRIKVQISDQMTVDGVAVRMSVRLSAYEYRVVKFNELGHMTFEDVDTTSAPMQVGATFQMPHDFANALLEALLRYYQGASDMHTTRSDLLHERGRVDKLIDTIGGIVTTIIRNAAER